MKTLIVAIFLTLCTSTSALAQYFRPIDIRHPQVSLGQFGNLSNGKIASGGMLALVTHSPADGCLIPKMCIDWTPLAIGGAYNSHEFNGSYLAIGPSANIVPAVKSLVLVLVNAVTKDGQLDNIKDLLAPPKMGTPDLTFAAGVNYGPVFAAGSAPRWMLTKFIGGEWRFGK